MRQTIETLRRKLDFLRQQEAITSDAAQKFTVGEQIKETESMIAEIERAFASPSTSAPSAFHAEISRILKYAPAQLIGREDDLKLLNDAWAQTQAHDPKRPRVLTIVALGGEGKTSLVAKWTAELAAQDWPGCASAFAWSFYSQGTREQLAASSDLFLKEALTFFGDDADKEIAASNAGSYEKGQRLARLVGQQRSLLILDGLEPLQYAPTAPAPGALKDQGVAALLEGLAAASQGLCVVTTRYSLPDLKAFWETTAQEVSLLRLSRDAGMHLLKALGVRGTADEFAKLVEDVKGHALTLTLIGSYLYDAHGGDIQRRDLVSLEKANEEELGGHAFRVMDAYVKWFQSHGEKGHRALAVLRCLGLFDRPATADCLNALQKAPAISGMTKALIDLSEEQLNVTFTRLSMAKLLTMNQDATGTLISLDSHQLVRAYFAHERGTHHFEAWRAAHQRLYEHLCASTPDNPQPTLEDLQPLYHAVAHGCQARMQQDAYDKVLYSRICRGAEFYTIRKLGAISAELQAVCCFFEQPWKRLATTLSGFSQGWLYNHASACLLATGRLAEALEPMQASLEAFVRLKDYQNAARASRNLGNLRLRLGHVTEALQDAERGVAFAKENNTAIEVEGTWVFLADVLHQAGRRSEALDAFRMAGEMEQRIAREVLTIHVESQFAYHDILLGGVERETWRTLCGLKTENLDLETLASISQRAAQTLKNANRNNWLLDIALDHLTLGRAALYNAILEGRVAFPTATSPSTQAPNFPASPSTALISLGETPALQTARCELDLAVDNLRRSGNIDDLPLGLLTRAWLRFLTGVRTGPESAKTDLDEAWKIAERGPMKLIMTDIHLYRARLFGMTNAEFRMPNEEKTYPWESPQHDLAAARRLIEQCGYWRRKEELEDAEAARKPES